MSNLIIESDIDTNKLHQKVNQIDSELHSLAVKAANSGSMLDKSFRQAGNSADQLSKKTINVGNAMASIGALVSLSVITSLGKEIVDVTAKFEKFGIVLRNSLGNVKGDEALAMIADFAATTPFQLDEVTGAFIKMTNQGFIPTQKEMVKLGDLASSTGKGFDQLAEAILDSQTGEFERLKEFGIKASQNGDRITFTFKEQKTTVENTASAIRGYILSLGELNGITGANAKISASLTGQISNLQDKLAAMYNEIGSENSGVIYTAVESAATLIENYKLIGTILGELISVYGAYKLAVMAVAYTEGLKATATARNMAIEAEYQILLSTSSAKYLTGKALEIASLELRERATLKVIAAERELAATQKASSLANPYVLAIMAVAALGYGIYKVVTHQTDLEKAISKTNTEIENEKDKVAQLFAALGHAKDGTEEWKKAKDDIIKQYGTYLTDQQKELLGTRNIAEAQKAVNDGLRENIALKVKQESLNAVSEKYNKDIANATQGINKAVKKALGIDRAAMADQEIAPLISNVKIAIDEESKTKATKELQDYLQNLGKEAKGDSKILDFDPDVMRFRGDLMVALSKWKTDVDAINKAFDIQMKSIEKKSADPVLTTYQSQIDALKAKKAIAEKELAALKTTPGEDPMKAVAAKQNEIDAINNQLGIREKEKNAVDQLKLAEEALEKAVKSGDKSAATAAANRVNQLQEEKRLLQENIDIELQKAWERQFDGKSMSAIPSGGIKPIAQVGTTKTVGGILYQITAIDKTGPTWKKVSMEQKKLQDGINDGAKKGADIQKDLDEENKKRKEQLNENILNYSRQFTSELIDQLGLTREQSKELNGIADIITNLIKGDSVGAAFGVASTLLTLLSGGKYEDPSLKSLERMNELLKQQSALLANLSGTDYFQLAARQYDELGKQIDGYTKKLQSSRITNITGVSGYYKDKSTEDLINMYTSGMIKLDSTQTEWITKIIELRKEQADLMQNTFSETLGFDSSAVVDSIIQGIDDGLKLAADNSLGGFAKSFGEEIKTALVKNIKEALEMKLTEGFMTNFKNFMSASSEGGSTLTADELSKLEAQYSSAVKDSTAAMAAIQPILDKYGLNLSNSSTALTGIASQMTEETGSLVAGQFMAMRVDMKSLNDTALNQLEIMDLVLGVLRDIAKNTSELRRLENVETKLDNINKTLKDGLL